MFNGYKPDWLYEALPYLYVAAGVLTLALLHNPLGVISGLLLISAGATIHMMRRSYRRALREQAEKMEQLRQRRESEARKQLHAPVWREHFAAGHQLIDSQHRALFAGAIELLESIQTGMSRQRILAEVDLLLDDLKLHLHSEERLMAETAYPAAHTHASRHAELLQHLLMLRAEVGEGRRRPAELYAYFCDEMLARHMVEDDAEFLIHLRACPEGAAASH